MALPFHVASWAKKDEGEWARSQPAVGMAEVVLHVDDDQRGPGQVDHDRARPGRRGHRHRRHRLPAQIDDVPRHSPRVAGRTQPDVDHTNIVAGCSLRVHNRDKVLQTYLLKAAS